MYLSYKFKAFLIENIIFLSFTISDILQEKNSALVLYIKAINITGFVHSQTDCVVIEEMYARCQNGNELPRNYVTPPKVWWRVIIWEVETGVYLPPFRVLKYRKKLFNLKLFSNTLLSSLKKVISNDDGKNIPSFFRVTSVLLNLNRQNRMIIFGRENDCTQLNLNECVLLEWIIKINYAPPHTSYLVLLVSPGLAFFNDFLLFSFF